MYTNSGQMPYRPSQELPNYYNNNNNQVYYQNQNQPNVVYVPQKIIVVESRPGIEMLTYPVLSTPAAILILLLNIFFPGVGTMVIGCISGTEVAGWICMGLLQLLLAFIIIGWIWAIFTGVMILSVSGSRL